MKVSKCFGNSQQFLKRLPTATDALHSLLSEFGSVVPSASRPIQGCRQRGFGESVTSRTAISWDGMGKADQKIPGLGGRSRESGSRESRPGHVTHSSPARPTTPQIITFVNVVESNLVVSPVPVPPSVLPAPPTSGLSQACTPKSATSHSDPLKILPSSGNVRLCIGKRRKEQVLSARLPLQAQQVVQVLHDGPSGKKKVAFQSAASIGWATSDDRCVKAGCLPSCDIL